jgi:phage tail sheath gpL-like
MTIRLPKTTINILSAQQPVTNQPQKMLFVGQMTTGTATSGQLYQNILNDASWDTLFGRNSMIAAMIRSAKLINNDSRLDAIALTDNVSGQPAVGSIVFTSPTSAGTINVIVGSSKNNTYTVPVTVSETIGNIAIAVAALINADTTSPVIATAPTSLSSPIFTGSGLDDLTVSGTYTATSNKIYIIKIDAVDTPDTFEWSDDNGSTWTTGVAITGLSQTLSNGVSITFGHTTGHTLHDLWTVHATANVLALTAINKGTEGNFISIAYTSSISNYLATITAMTGGATNPILTTLFTPIAQLRYQTIIYPSSWDLSVLTDLLDPRWNVNNKVMDGIGVLSKTDTAVNLITILNALNDHNIAIHCNKKITASNLKGSAIVELDYVIASQIGAINALRLTQNSNLSSYNTSARGLDALGGPAIASLPFFNTPVVNLPLVDNSNEWTDDEMDDLKTAGGFVLGNNPTNDEIIFGETVTTYKNDSAGNADVTFKYLEYVETESQIREYFYNNVRAKFAQCRLTAGDIIRENMANAALISAYFDTLYSQLASANYVLTQAGEDALAYFKANKTVTVDIATGMATVTMIVPIVTQLREIYAEMQIGFNFNQ